MQGSILYIDQKQGFIQGSDQSRYYFTDADWRGTTAPVMGQAVTFQPDGQNAREVQPPVAQPASGWGQSQPAPPPQPGPHGPATYGVPDPTAGSLPSEVTVTKSVYNLPIAGAALLLLVSLMLPYGRLFADYRLTDTGLGAFYFVLPMGLVAVLLLGTPRPWALGLWGASLVATLAAIMGRDSLFSRLSEARAQAGRMSDATTGLFGAQLQGQMQAAVPSLTENLTGGFYLHTIALLALGYLLLFYRYEVRAGGVSLETIGNTAGAGANMAAEASRNLVAGAERLTGQSAPTAEQTGNFLKNFLTFDRMIAPTIITIMYYINLVVVILAGIVLIFLGLFASRYGAFGLGVSFSGVLALVFGPLWVRLFAEFLIVVFKIHDRLRHIDDKTKA